VTVGDGVKGIGKGGHLRELEQARRFRGKNAPVRCKEARIAINVESPPVRRRSLNEEEKITKARGRAVDTLAQYHPGVKPARSENTP